MAEKNLFLQIFLTNLQKNFHVIWEFLVVLRDYNVLNFICYPLKWIFVKDQILERDGLIYFLKILLTSVLRTLFKDN